MAKRYFNWTLAIVLVVAAAVLVVGAVGLRGWQRRARADRALPLGEEAFARGDWDQAAQQLGQYVAIHNDDIPAMLKYAEAQMKRRPLAAGTMAMARSVYAGIMRDRQADPNLVREAAVTLIELDLQGNAVAEARVNAREYLDNADDPTIRRLWCIALQRLEQWQEAAAALSDLLEDYPDEVLAYEVMGALAENHPGDVNRPAEYWFDEAVRRNPDSALAYIVRADAQLRRDDPNAAVVDLEQAQTLDLSDRGVRLRLAASLANAQKPAEAREQLSLLQTEAPDMPGLHEMRAALALMSGSPDEMRDVARTGLEALAKQPWDFMPIATELCIRAGDTEQADAYIARMRERGVMPPTVAYLEGRTAVQRGRWQDAVNSWQRAIALNYNDYLSFSYGSPPPVRMALASAYEQLGEIQSAIGQMRTFVSDWSDSGDPRVQALRLSGRLYLGQLLIRVGDWSGAMDQARSVRLLDSQSSAAAMLQLRARVGQLQANREPLGSAAWQEVERQLTALGQTAEDALGVGLLRARVAMGRGQLEDAEILLNELDRDHPNQAQVAQFRAILYLAQAERHRGQDQGQLAADKEQEALEVLRRAVEALPQSIEPVQNLARALLRQEKTQECEDVLTAAMARIEQAPARRQLGLWLANLYATWGQEDKRHDLLSSLAEQYPTDIQIKRNLLSLESVVAQPAEAQRLIDEIKAVEGEAGWQWRLEQARLLILTNPNTLSTRYAEIVGLLQKNLQTNPDDTDSRLLLAQTYDMGGEMQLASAMYRQVLAREPDNVTVIARTVNALIRAGQTDEAMQILDQAEQRDLYHPDLAELRLNQQLQRGSASRDAEERREALDSATGLLQGMLAQDPNNLVAGARLALVLARQQKFEEAQVILDELEASGPQKLYIQAAQVELYTEQGDAEKALQLCDAVVTELNSATAYVLRARTYAAFGRPDEALSDLTQAVEIEPETPNWRLVRAEFYSLLGRLSDAMADVRQALALAPDNINAQRLAVRFLLSSGRRSDLSEAQRLLDAALAGNPQDPGLRLLRARLLLRMQTPPANQQARSVLTALTKSHPKTVEAWALLGRLELAEDRPGVAIDLATQGLAQNPQEPSLLLLKADAEFQRSPSVAIPTLETLADRYPQDLNVIRRLGSAYADSDSPRAALELIQRTLASLAPDARRTGEIALAPIMYRSGDQANAKALLNNLLQAEPNDPNPLLGLAEFARLEQDWQTIGRLITDWMAAHPDDVEVPTVAARMLIADGADAANQTAEQILRDLLQRHATSIIPLRLLALITQTSDRGAESAQLNRRILELDPNDVVAANNLAWYLSEEQGQPGEALKLVEAGLTLAPDYTDMRDTRGVIYFRLGQYEDALSDLTTCVEQYAADNPALAGARFHLGRTYERLSSNREAREELTQALSLHAEIGGLSPEDLAEANRLLTGLRAEE